MAQIMESTSEAMKIQISEATQRLLDEKTDERRRSLTDYGIGLAQNMNSPKFITQLRDKVNIHFMSLLLSDDVFTVQFTNIFQKDMLYVLFIYRRLQYLKLVRL